MITTGYIQSVYGLPMKRKFRKVINLYIQHKEVQAIIKRAMNQALSDDDYNWLMDNGGFNGRYQYLNWLCTIYIHPLTIAQNILRLAVK